MAFFVCDESEVYFISRGKQKTLGRRPLLHGVKPGKRIAERQRRQSSVIKVDPCIFYWRIEEFRPKAFTSWCQTGEKDRRAAAKAIQSSIVVT
jgi:hypothetical protein